MVILSESMAEKYFGADDPLGEHMTLTFGKDRRETFRVGGVAEEFSLSASFGFGLLITYDKLFDLGAAWDDWGALTTTTFIQMRDPGAIDALAAQMERYRTLHNAASTNREIAAFRFDPLLNIPFSAESVRGNISDGTSLGDIILLASLGLILLALACFNYMNIAIASAARRLKEIGIRKAVGATRRTILVQFLIEAIIVCVVAGLIGVALSGVVAVIINSFFTAYLSPGTVILAFSICVGVGLVFGLVPAWSAAKAHPIEALRYE